MKQKFSTLLVKRPATIIKLFKNQYLDRSRIILEQNRKLQEIVHHAYKHVAYYTELFRKADILPSDIKSIEDLKKIPISQKKDLQIKKSESVTSNRFDFQRLKTERTSGSSGRPFTVYIDDRFASVRDALFLRALLTAGYRPGHKLMLVTDNRNKRNPRNLFRWSYASIEQSAVQILSLFNRVKPQILYGCTTSLKLMANEMRTSKKRYHSPKRIITAAEMLDDTTRILLEETFDAELFDFYGLTEMGIVGWECPAHQGYHLAEDTAVIEFLPVKNDSELKRLVMTNLTLKSMPFIRYETGDVGIPSSSEICSCGRQLAMLKKVEGRKVDCIKLRNGLTISPYRITCAIEQLDQLVRYKVIQKDYDQFNVKVQSEECDRIKEADVRRLLQTLIGPGIQVNIELGAQIEPEPGKKFRVIESNIQ